MRRALRYTLATAGVAMLIALVGVLTSAGAARAGVMVGAGVAFLSQVLVFWLLFVWLLPDRQVMAHGLGMLVRLGVLGGLALAVLPRPEVAAAPALFALVGVFFVSTVFEPLFLRPESLRR